MAAIVPWNFFLEAKNAVGNDNDGLVQLTTVPPGLTNVVVSTAVCLERDLSPVVPNTAALARCITEGVAHTASITALLVHVWHSGYDLRCVFKCRSGSLFAAYMPNGIPTCNGSIDQDFRPGCCVMLTNFRVFDRVRTNTTMGCFLATEMVILECEVTGEALPPVSQDLDFIDGQLIYGYTVASIERAYRNGECILEINGAVQKDYTRADNAVTKFIDRNLRNVPAVDVQVTHQLKPEVGDDGSEEADDDESEATEYGLMDRTYRREYSVTKRRLATRREETMEAALSQPQPGGCECLQKFGVVGCIVHHLPPEEVHAADYGTPTARRPYTLEVARWEPSRFFHWYSRVLGDPRIDSTEEARSTCMETAVRNFVAARQAHGPPAQQPQGPQA